MAGIFRITFISTFCIGAFLKSSENSEFFIPILGGFERKNILASHMCCRSFSRPNADDQIVYVFVSFTSK
jgi:hypothetical protein